MFRCRAGMICSPSQRVHVISENSEFESLLLADTAELVMTYYPVSVGRAFVRDVANGNGLANLMRYETGHVRNLQRLYTQLAALQDARTERAAAAPTASPSDTAPDPPHEPSGDPKARTGDGD
jgi:hypothetical protein